MKYSFIRMVVGLTSVVYMLTAIWIATAGFSDRIIAADVAIVPGSMVDTNGQPSPRLTARLDKAVELFRKGLVHYVFVSGGHGKEGFDEGTIMHDYLLRHDVPEAAVIVDNSGDNTLATTINGIQIVEAKGWRRVMVVTQFFHIARLHFAIRHFDCKLIVGHAHAQ